MKKTAIWTVVLAGMAAVAWGTWHEVEADGETVAPLEWVYAGRIADSQGNAVTGAQTLVARLYGSAEGGEALWARKVPVLLDGDGNFSVRLSDALEAVGGAPEVPLARVLAGNTCWIECQIEGHSRAMAPRAAVAAVPYALFADAASGAREDFEAAVSLVVAGEATAGSVSARDAESDGAVKVGGALAVGGDASMAGGLRAGSYSGMGVMPVGSVILWYGDPDRAPDGWAFCDGQDGRPDLRGRFPVGAGRTYSVGNMGGKETVTLTEEELPSHGHGYELRDEGNRDEPSWANDDDDNVWANDTTNRTSSVGGGKAHENLPPYRTLWYIVRVE